MFSSKEFEKLCTPAKLYFALAILSIIIGLFSGFHFMAVLMKLIFAVFYTVILGWLCKKGWKGLAWFLVLLPYVLMMLMFFGVISMAKKGMSMSMMMPGYSPQQRALNA